MEGASQIQERFDEIFANSKVNISNLYVHVKGLGEEAECFQIHFPHVEYHNETPREANLAPNEVALSNGLKKLAIMFKVPQFNLAKNAFGYLVSGTVPDISANGSLCHAVRVLT